MGVIIKQERSSGSSRSRSGGGGGGGGQESKGGVPAAAYVSNNKMKQVLRCEDGDLDVLKHSFKTLYKALVDDDGVNVGPEELAVHVGQHEPEHDEMLSGDRWETEEYPHGDLQRDLKDVRTKLFYIAKISWSLARRGVELRRRRRREMRRRVGTRGVPIVIED